MRAARPYEREYEQLNCPDKPGNIKIGGEGGIRTLEAPCGHLYDFQSYSLGLSDTSPREWSRRANHERAMRSFVYHGRRWNVSPPSQSRLDFYAFFFDDPKHVRKEVILI